MKNILFLFLSTCACVLAAQDVIFIENFSRFRPGTPVCANGEWEILKSEGKNILYLPKGGQIFSNWAFLDHSVEDYTFRIRFQFCGENDVGMLKFVFNSGDKEGSPFPYKQYQFLLARDKAMLTCLKGNGSWNSVDPLQPPPQIALPEPLEPGRYYEIACTVHNGFFAASLTMPDGKNVPLYSLKTNPGTGPYAVSFTGAAKVDRVTVTTAKKE